MNSQVSDRKGVDSILPAPSPCGGEFASTCGENAALSASRFSPANLKEQSRYTAGLHSSHSRPLCVAF